MVKIWIHKHGSTEPQLVTEISLQDCASQFDLAAAKYLQPLSDAAPTAASPGPLGDDADPQLVVFEVLAGEETGQIKAGYYASKMSADTVQELIGEE